MMPGDQNNNRKPVLLAVLAHPDDESFGTGGTLAMYARRDVDVYLVCATRGEVGEMDPRWMEGFTTIAERREYELRCAAEKLGLAGVFFLDYRDSGMPGSPDNHHPQALAAQPLEAVAENITCYIRSLRPHVVITFDPIGGYRHPDHIAVHNATVKAFAAASDPAQYPASSEPPYAPQKLYFHTFPRGFLRLVVRLMPLFGRNPRQFGANKDIDMVSIAEVDFPVNAVVDYRPVSAVRDAAANCHGSQGGGGLTGGLLGKLRGLFAAQETFMRAYPPVTGRLRERDLFEGVDLHR